MVTVSCRALLFVGTSISDKGTSALNIEAVCTCETLVPAYKSQPRRPSYVNSNISTHISTKFYVQNDGRVLRSLLPSCNYMIDEHDLQ